MHLPDPRFPPLLRGHSVKAPLRPLPKAAALAQRGELGAGDIVWARDTATAEMAVVLEPDIACSRLGEIRVLMQVAIVHALATVMPEQTAIQIGWPDTLLCNGASVGQTGFALAAHDTTGAQAPDWAVAGLSIRLSRDLDALEPGIVKAETSLSEEDGGQVDRTQIIEAIAAHLLKTMHEWEVDGIRPAVDRWVGRVLGYETPVAIQHPAAAPVACASVIGQIVGVDEDMGLMVRTETGDLCTLKAPLVGPSVEVAGS